MASTFFSSPERTFAFRKRKELMENVIYCLTQNFPTQPVLCFHICDVAVSTNLYYAKKRRSTRIQKSFSPIFSPTFLGKLLAGYSVWQPLLVVSWASHKFFPWRKFIVEMISVSSFSVIIQFLLRKYDFVSKSSFFWDSGSHWIIFECGVSVLKRRCYRFTSGKLFLLSGFILTVIKMFLQRWLFA